MARQQLIKLKQAFAPDLVHVHNFGPSVLFYLDTAHASPASLLVTLTNELELVTDKQDLLRRLLSSAEWVTGKSAAVLAEAHRLAPQILPRSSVIHNGLAVPTLSPAPLPLARLVAVQSDRNRRKPGEIEATLGREWAAIEPKVRRNEAVVISGASGLEPPTSAEKKALEKIGLPVRATGTHIGHGFDTQFLANLAITGETLRQGKLFPASGSGDTGESPGKITQVAITSVGNWRGEGIGLIEKVA
jgi:hypothetical protein